tara:strand:- start:334 stop:438 length:105 start_codon:yes stop_codon:yes gene_type:complete
MNTNFKEENEEKINSKLKQVIIPNLLYVKEYFKD